MFLVGTLLRFGIVTAWLFHLVACMGGCLGCDAKNRMIKGQENQPHPTSKPSMTEGVWTSNKCDIDNSVLLSHGNPSFGSHGIGNTSHGFINHGFLLWSQIRQQWVGNKRMFKQEKQHREPRLSWNVTYDSLLGSNKPFAKPVPLSEMVDFLVDVWEQEGTYD